MMRSKLLYILFGLLICFSASLLLEYLTMDIIENGNTNSLFILLIPVVILCIGILVLIKGIRIQVNKS